MSIEIDKDFEQLEDIAAMMAENPGIEFENGNYVYHGLDGRTAFAAVYIAGSWAGWKAAKAQAVPELTDKMIVAIESEVESQLKASAIDADPFRLDGEKIWYAALEAQEPK